MLIQQAQFLTIVDEFCKYAQAYNLKKAQGTEIVINLIKYLMHHIIPEQIISDTEINLSPNK